MGAPVFDADATVAAFGGVDVDSLTTSEVHAMVMALARVADALEAKRAEVLARWDADRTWADNGSRNAASRLWNETKCAPSTARRLMRRARGLRQAPVTCGALGSGEITVDRADLLVRLNTPDRRERFLEAEGDLVGMCATLRHADLELALAYWRNHADAERDSAADDPPDGDLPSGETSELYLAELMEGVTDVRGTLGAVDGDIVAAEIDRLAERIRLDDQRDGRERTPAQRRAAALVEMAARSGATPKGARRPAPLFSVLMGHDSFERLCQLASGRVVTPEQLVPHLDQALLESILFDGPYTVVTVSHRRTFTGALRRAIEVRDRHCRHPAGCDEPLTRTDVDHITPHSRGGPTAQWNGRLQCKPHNRNKQLHDHDATPYPPREFTPLEAVRHRLRYQLLRAPPPADP